MDKKKTPHGKRIKKVAAATAENSKIAIKFSRNAWELRQTYKDIFELSTKDSLYSNDSEVNDLKMLLADWKLLGTAILFLLSGVTLFSNANSWIWLLLALFISIGIWHFPSLLVKWFCNEMIFTCSKSLKDEPNRASMLRGFPRLLNDLKKNNLYIEEGEFSNFEIHKDSPFGWVINFSLSGKVINEPVKSQYQALYRKCYIIPIVIDRPEDGHFILNSEFTVAFGYYARNDLEGFSDKISESKELGNVFNEKRDQIEKTKKTIREKEVLDSFKNAVKSKNVNDRVVSILRTIIQNRNDWNLYPWKLENFLEGDENYARFRLKSENHVEFRNVKKLESQLERRFNCGVIINSVFSDRRYVTILVIFQPLLEKFTKPFVEIKQSNDTNNLYLGRSIIGDLSVGFNEQANHTLITGESGAGKSQFLLGYIHQLFHLDKYKFGDLYIGSSSKIADFMPFTKQKNGAHLVEGVEKVSEMVNHVLFILKERETLFAEKDVNDLEAYNMSVPKSEKLMRIVVVIDEYQSILQADKAKSVETAVLRIMSQGRSAGCLMVLSTQSITKQNIGAAKDFVQTQFIGYMKPKTAIDAGVPKIGEYFEKLKQSRGNTTGAFLFESSNLDIPTGQVFNETGMIAIQTPYISSDWQNFIPEIRGKDLINVNFVNDSGTSALDNIDI